MTWELTGWAIEDNLGQTGNKAQKKEKNPRQNIAPEITVAPSGRDWRDLLLCLQTQMPEPNYEEVALRRSSVLLLGAGYDMSVG